MRTRERQTNFIDLFKAFWAPDEIETSFEEEISANNFGLSEEDKKLLTETSSHIKALEKELYNHNIDKPKRKTAKAKVAQNEMGINKSINKKKQSNITSKEEKDFGERE